MFVYLYKAVFQKEKKKEKKTQNFVQLNHELS